MNRPHPTVSSNPNTLVEARGLTKRFPTGPPQPLRNQRWLTAVDGISFTIQRGETLALVGESGSGKTTVARLLLGLIPPTAGSISYEGQELASLTSAQMQAFRRKVQIIFQDPFSALDPRMRIGLAVTEGLRVHHRLDRRARARRAGELLKMVGLDPSMHSRFPHELSGGQRQRVVIARALALNPEFLVADEPLSALDVSIQAQIVNLMGDLKAEFDLTFLFISHDLAMVDHLADRVAVMYLGDIVEQGPVDRVLDAPQHPYTRMLLAAVPTPRSGDRSTSEARGEPPNIPLLPTGCRFHPRCGDAILGRCADLEPADLVIAEDHRVRCWLYQDESPAE